MNVVMAMAGRGSRFRDAESSYPKPLIEVAGRPMFAWALQSLACVEYQRLIFVGLREHDEQFSLCKSLKEWAPVNVEIEILLLDNVTEGQLCTVLACREWIDSPDGLLITCSDTLIESQIGRDIQSRSGNCSGMISVADLPGNRWSFARTDEFGRVEEVAEKRRISNYASTGLYYFANGTEFVVTADQMIKSRELTNGEYFVIPVYGKYIARGQRIEVSHATRVLDMGTPAALTETLAELAATNRH